MGVKEIIKPGDLISFYDTPGLWPPSQWLMWPPYWGICKYQENYFGTPGDTKTAHTEVYLDDNHILNAIPPKVKWSTLKELNGRKIKVFRPTFYSFLPEHAETMIREFENEVEYTDDGGKYKAKLIGSDYDLGQILCIAINGYLGYPNQYGFDGLDQGKDHKVCSVICRLFYEHFRKIKGKEMGNDPYKTLFNKINPDAFFASRWKDKIIGHFRQHGKLYTEMTVPATFTNSRYFNNEFTCIYCSF